MEQLKEIVEQHHNPDLIREDAAPNNLQYLVFEDGEIVLTQNGDKFLRDLSIVRRKVYKPSNQIKFPMSLDQHTFVVVKDNETAEMIRDAIASTRT